MRAKKGRKEWCRITINVTPELGAEIKRRAVEDRRSVSKFASKIVEDHFEATPPKTPRG